MAGKKLIKALIPVALIILVCSLAFGGRSCEGTVKEYIKASVEGNAKKVVSLMPDEYVDAEIRLGIYPSKSAIIDDIQNTMDETIKLYDDIFGSRWKFDYSIDSTYTYSEDELERYLYYNDYANIASKVRSAARVSYTVTIYGNGESGALEGDILLFKIGRRWYLGDI